MQKIQKIGFALTVTTLLMAGCGGGGGGSPAIPVFALAASNPADVANAVSGRYAVSGTCTGTQLFNKSATVPAVFEGVSGFSDFASSFLTLSNCTPSPQLNSQTNFYNSAFVPLGFSVAGGNGLYGIFTPDPAPMPTSVKIGDTGPRGTRTVYADSSKAVVTSREVFTYVIEANADGSAILNLVIKSSNPANQPLFTQQTRYQIASDGSSRLIVIDLQYSTTSSNHLIFTPL